MPKPSASSPFFVLRFVPREHASIWSIVKSKENEEAKKIVEKFHIAKNNPFYDSMFEVVSIVVLGYKGPSYNDLRSACPSRGKG